MLPDLKRKDKKGTTCDWPNARAKKIYETVQRAQRAALDNLLTPNSTDVVYAAQVDQAARKVIADEGWGSYFTHRLGHGTFSLSLSLSSRSPLLLGCDWTLIGH